MSRGDNSSYTTRQKRMSAHIEQSHELRGIPAKQAESRAWATVNKETHGGQASRSGRGKADNPAPAGKGGKRGGAAQTDRPAKDRAASARRAMETRKRNDKPPPG